MYFLLLVGNPYLSLSACPFILNSYFVFCNVTTSISLFTFPRLSCSKILLYMLWKLADISILLLFLGGAKNEMRFLLFYFLQVGVLSRIILPKFIVLNYKYIESYIYIYIYIFMCMYTNVVLKLLFVIF